MATLNESLSKAKSPSYNYSYRPPRMENPYSRGAYGANIQMPQQQPLMQSLAQQTPPPPVPSSRYAAEYDYDPLLARISAMSDMTIANARSEAEALRKRAFIEAGDPNLSRELGADENTITAAQQNPFSTRERLSRDYAERGRQLDESMNQQNLFYSGERARQLGEQERGRAQAETDFGKVLRDLLANITTGLTYAEEAEIARNLANARAAPPSGSPGGGPAPAPAPAPTPTLPAPTGTFPDGTPMYTPVNPPPIDYFAPLPTLDPGWLDDPIWRYGY